MSNYTREELVEFLRSEARIANDDFWDGAGVSVKFKAAADMLERDGEQLKRKGYTTVEPGPEGATFR